MRLGPLGVAALIVLATSACGPAQKNAAPATSSSSVPATTTTTAASPAPKPDASVGRQLVTSVAIVDKDVPQGLKVKPYDHGDQVEGQVTLDNCGYRYSTEAHRIARRQVEVVTDKGEDTGLSNEVVAYDSEEQAAKALAEYRTSVRSCRKNTWVSTPTKRSPQLRYLTDTLSFDGRLPVRDNAIAVFSVQVKGSARTFYNISILQRHGTVLDNIYFAQLVEISPNARGVAMSLADLTGRRLAKLAEGTTV